MSCTALNVVSVSMTCDCTQGSDVSTLASMKTSRSAPVGGSVTVRVSSSLSTSPTVTAGTVNTPVARGRSSNSQITVRLRTPLITRTSTLLEPPMTSNSRSRAETSSSPSRSVATTTKRTDSSSVIDGDPS